MKKTIKFILLIAIVFGSFSCGKTILEPADAPTQAPPKEGDYYQGGYIIYLDNDKKHGIIAAPSDASYAGWAPSNLNTGATSSGKYGGFNNTPLIILAHGTGFYAASLCDQYSNDGYTDWYLPALDEMYDLYDNKSKIGLNSGIYWSSTEISSSVAYAFHMTNFGSYSAPKSSAYFVRAVRKF